MSDPEHLPGLAHFCEHMLFLGTEKYPHENGYTTYLSQSGGSSNAATYPLMTKYHFHVAPDKLDGALDRFAQFFIAPLFTPSATEREINAVCGISAIPYCTFIECNLCRLIRSMKRIYQAICGGSSKCIGIWPSRIMRTASSAAGTRPRFPKYPSPRALMSVRSC